MSHLQQYPNSVSSAMEFQKFLLSPVRSPRDFPVSIFTPHILVCHLLDPSTLCPSFVCRFTEKSSLSSLPFKNSGPRIFSISFPFSVCDSSHYSYSGLEPLQRLYSNSPHSSSFCSDPNRQPFQRYSPCTFLSSTILLELQSRQDHQGDHFCISTTQSWWIHGGLFIVFPSVPTFVSVRTTIRVRGTNTPNLPRLVRNRSWDTSHQSTSQTPLNSSNYPRTNISSSFQDVLRHSGRLGSTVLGGQIWNDCLRSKTENVRHSKETLGNRGRLKIHRKFIIKELT